MLTLNARKDLQRLLRGLCVLGSGLALVACGSPAEDEPVVDSTQLAATSILVDDGFEFGIFPPWFATGATFAGSSSRRTGALGAGLSGWASLTIPVDATGLSNVRLSYDRRTVGYDTGEYLYAGWLPYGAADWIELERVRSGTWGTGSFVLQNANAGLGWLSFWTEASLLSERADLDNIRVTGDTTAPVRCDDGVKNGTETDVDCGGATCAPCADGADCTANADCASKLCSLRSCSTPSRTTPLLVVLLDFSDTSMDSVLPNSEAGWSGLIFGGNQAQANHYFSEVSGGDFQLKPAAETYGAANNGVVRVQLSVPRPTGTTKYVIQNQPWIRDALNRASSNVNFASFDGNGNGRIDNLELSILFVLNINYQNVSGSGAESNIAINHSVNGTGPVVEKFARTQWDYTSIGVNVHELGHHIFDLDHLAAPNDHCLMGLGAYTQDPVIGTLHNPSDHWGTRPTQLIGWNKYLAGFVTPTAITASTTRVELHSPHTGRYNVVTLPVVDGLVYLENRTREGYDQSIAFCGHAGGLFNTEVSQYVRSINIPAIVPRRDTFAFDIPAENICDHYSLSGHNGSFSIGQYTISNVSAPGPTMTFDVIKNAVTPAIQAHKYRYWINDVARPGYRQWHVVTAQAGATTTIDVSTFPFGNDASSTFTISLDSYFNTGEVRSVNLDTTFTTSSSYLRINKFPVTGGRGTVRGDAIVQLTFNPSAAYEASALVNVSRGSFNSSFRLTNLPRF